MENVVLGGLERLNCQACKKHLKDGSSFDNPIPQGDPTDPRYIDKMIKFFSHGMGWSIEVDLSTISIRLSKERLKIGDLKHIVMAAGFGVMIEKRKVIRELDLLEALTQHKYPDAAYGFEDPGSDPDGKGGKHDP